MTTASGNTYKLVGAGDIFIEGKHGLFIKYEAMVIDEPQNQRDARELFEHVRKEADGRGLGLVAIMAVVPNKGAGPFHSSRTNNIGFEKGADGLWYRIPPGRKGPSILLDPLPGATTSASTTVAPSSTP